MQGDSGPGNAELIDSYDENHPETKTDGMLFPHPEDDGTWVGIDGLKSLTDHRVAKYIQRHPWAKPYIKA